MFRRSGDERGGGLFPEGGPTPILIVEDDEGLALLMEESLQGLSLECARAATGGETLQWFDSQRSGLLLLDYSLPDMTGLEVLSRLEKVGMRPPFIVTTGVGDEKLAVEMMKRGARDYLVKDKEFLAALPATVSRVLRELRGEEELRRVREDLAEREKLIEELRRLLENVKELNGLLPICCNCKKIRDDKGYWHQVENYIEKHSRAEFTHGLCPECRETLYPKRKKKEEQES